MELIPILSYIIIFGSVATAVLALVAFLIGGKGDTVRSQPQYYTPDPPMPQAPPPQQYAPPPPQQPAAPQQYAPPQAYGQPPYQQPVYPPQQAYQQPQPYPNFPSNYGNPN